MIQLEPPPGHDWTEVRLALCALADRNGYNHGDAAMRLLLEQLACEAMKITLQQVIEELLKGGRPDPSFGHPLPQNQGFYLEVHSA